MPEFAVGADMSAHIGKPVVVRLKNGMEFKGGLVGFDEYLNLVIKDAQQIGVEGKKFDTLIFKGGLVGSIIPG